MRQSILAAVIAAALVLPAAHASAQLTGSQPDSEAAPQTSPEARAVLENTAIAVQKLDALAARVALVGGGSDMFVKFMPTAEATLHARRSAEGEPGPWTTRVFGVGKDRSDTGEEYSYDFAFNGTDLTWIEHASKSVKTAPMDRARGGGFSMREHLNFDELLAEEPLSRELAPGATHTLEQRQTIDGVECDVVLVAYAEEPQRRGARKAKHNKSRWFLSVDDSMPRRIERIHDTAYKLSLIVTVSDVKLNPPLTDGEMTVRVPDGYEQIDQRATAPRIGSVPASRAVDRGEDKPAARAEQDPTADRHAAPDFSLKTPSGQSVTLKDQRGKITVLYFWGTWCVPCYTYSPMVSALTETFSGEPVSVLAPTYLETAPGAAAERVASKGYKYTLLLDADEMRRDYRVYHAPTIDVIDAEGRLIIREINSKEETAEEIMGRVERTIREELARMQGG